MLGQLHHIEINVKNFQESINFWEWFLKELGYSNFQEWDKGKSYKKDKTYIVFVETKEKSKFTGKSVGLNHVAFHADSREFVDKMTNEIREKGLKVLYEDEHPFAGGKDYYALYFEDPNGIKVELVAPN